MIKALELLGRPVNFAVVQLPERNYPGVVIQGDTLNGLVRRLEEMSALVKSNQLEDLTMEIEEMREQLSAARGYYEATCTEHGIELPYPKTTL
ncbi:putative S18 family serine protease [Variovorax boronicumulans]|nr:putative S18 family serine protease [Variovorax boronicumulans]